MASMLVQALGRAANAGRSNAKPFLAASWRGMASTECSGKQDTSAALQFQNMGDLTSEEEQLAKAISHTDPDARPKWQLLHQVAVRKGLKHYVDPVTADIVMTELALKEGGECCGNLCRHCPWGNVGSGVGGAGA